MPWATFRPSLRVIRFNVVRTEFVSSRGLAGWVTGTGPEVLLLHGGPGMTDYMESLLPELDGYRVASFQQRGVEPSTLAGPFDVPTLRDDVVDVVDALGWGAPTILGHSWGGHLLFHLLAAAPDRVGAALAVDPLGAVGDGGLAAFEAELGRRLPAEVMARLGELDELERSRPLTVDEALEAMAIAWPGYFSSLEVAQPIPQRGHAPSAESWASIEAELPGLAEKLRGCAVPTRFVHGELDPLPVSASAETAEILGATVDVLPGNGHFPWLEDPGCVRRSLDRLLRG
jgi:pimeloyl-ACP methyl ester carboxylesterase